MNVKAKNNTSKLQYITVKEIQDIKLSIPSVDFNHLSKSFMEVYELYKKAFKNLSDSKKKLDEYKSTYLNNNKI